MSELEPNADFKRELSKALQAAAPSDATLSPEADRRLRGRLGLAPPIQRTAASVVTSARRRWLGGATALAAAAGLLLWLMQATPSHRAPADGLAHSGAIAVTTPVSGWRGQIASDRIEVTDGTLALDLGASRVQVDGPGELRIVDRQIRVASGTVEFEVRPSSAEVVTLVSHGKIIVHGTRYTVVQAADHGAVTLHEGSIEFVDLAGTSTRVAPGQTLTWPQAPAEPTPAAPVAQPTPAHDAPRSTPALTPAPDFSEILGEIENYRARRDTTGLRQYLRAIPQRGLTAEQRDLLEIEQIMALAADKDQARTCDAIDRYLRQTGAAAPPAASRARIQAVATRLQCAKATPPTPNAF